MTITACKYCGAPFVQYHCKHFFCCSNCQKKFSYHLLTPQQKKARKSKNLTNARKHARKHYKAKHAEILKRRRTTDGLQRVFLADRYIKTKLRQQGFTEFPPEVIELKRIEISLKRAKYESKKK